MQITDKRQVGDIGEKASRKYLKKNGYNIVAKNYNTKYGEIDIVAENKLMKTAYVYLKEYPTNKNIRFDIIEVIHNSKKVVSINHIKNAFMQGGSYGSF